jgi:hypothetical protein
MTGLPAGLAHSGAVISGTPTAPPGTYPVTVQAVNSEGSTSRLIALSVVDAPQATTDLIDRFLASLPPRR